jgi:hypothetical protein
MKPVTIALENYLHHYHGDEKAQLQRALEIVNLITDDSTTFFYF